MFTLDKYIARLLKPRYSYWVLILIVHTPVVVLSQQYSYVHYDTKDGLAGLTVHGIAQDKEGFLWFATETGLSRFDGTHFKNFTRADGLPSNEVFGIFADSKNRIWFTTFKNAICYYRNGKIYNQQNDSTLKKVILNSIISAIGENSAGDMLICCSSTNEFLIIKNNGDVVKLTNQHVDIIRGLAIFPASVVSVPEKIRKLAVGYENYCAPITGSRFPISKRNYLFTKVDSVFCILENNYPGYSFRLPDQTRHVGYLDDSTIVIFGLNSGGARLYDIYKRRFIATYLPEYTIHTVFKDMEGCLWFSTREAGVFRLSNPTYKNAVFYNDKTPLAVLSIHKINNQIYVGTDNAQYWRLKLVQTDMSQSKWHLPEKIDADAGLLRNERAGQLINYSSSNFFGFKFMGHSIKTLHVFNDTLLVASSLGAYLFHLPSMRKISELHSSRTTVACKKGNTFYIGTLNGLYTVTGNNQEVFLGKKNPLFKSRISSFAEGSDGTLWIATYEAGIIGYRNGEIVANITQRNGNLSSDICRCIFISGNTLWVGTEKGLNKVDISRGQYKTTEKFTAKDGLGTDIINSIYTEGNMVFVGTSAGLTYFDQTKVPKHSICYIRLTGVSVSGKQENPENNNLVLSHRDNNIRFEFAGISFLSSGDITYEYRLRGLSDEWKTIKEKVLNYPLLPSGIYTLELKATNKFNDSSEIRKYHFEIKPTLWETSWFLTIIVILTISVIWFSLQWRIRQIRRKEKEKRLINKKIAGLEQMALRAQMNPHFIFNCLNSIQHYIIKQDVKGANFYLTQFAGLVRKTLENSSKIYVPLSEEITYLSNYIELEKLQLANSFEYEIKANMENKETIKIPNMVIQPYVENAIKHGVSHLSSGGKIILTFNYHTDQRILECVVEDNGPGFKQVNQNRENKTHHSKGMSITSGRIDILNQLFPGEESITVQISEVTKNDRICGTQVVLRFPFHNVLNY